MTAPDSIDLGAFLRTRRARLAPGDVGLRPVEGERRRTPGLRREEVAQLCGVSATWYTWLEQGRPISMSPEALARLATVLRLSRAERAYLFELTRKRDPDGMTPNLAAAALPGELMSALGAITVPAYCLDVEWRARGWNEAAAQLLSAWLDGTELNLLRWMFLAPAARSFVVDWPERAARLVAEFRAHAAGLPESAGVAHLVDDLRRRDPYFAALWEGQGVRARLGGLRQFDHPAMGIVSFQHVTLVPASHDAFLLVMLLPAGDNG